MRYLTLLVLAILAAPFAAQAQSLGNLAQYPPVAKDLTITTSPNGSPILSPMDTVLFAGQYYRVTVHCPDVTGDLAGWRIELSELLRNAHLRLVTVGDIEVHLQGLSFNAIECDEAGSAHISFVPIKPGRLSLVCWQCATRCRSTNWGSRCADPGKIRIWTYYRRIAN